MSNTLTPRSLRVTDKSRRYVRGTDKVREDQLRRRAGAAETRLEGTVSEQSTDIGRKHQATVRRRQGVGPLADTLIEVYAHETNGRDTSSYVEALIATQTEARGTLALCPKALAREEAHLDGAEDIAEAAYLTGAATAAEWKRALVAYVAHATRMIRAL